MDSVRKPKVKGHEHGLKEKKLIKQKKRESVNPGGASILETGGPAVGPQSTTTTTTAAHLKEILAAQNTK